MITSGICSKSGGAATASAPRLAPRLAFGLVLACTLALVPSSADACAPYVGGHVETAAGDPADWGVAVQITTTNGTINTVTDECGEFSVCIASIMCTFCSGIDVTVTIEGEARTLFVEWYFHDFGTWVVAGTANPDVDGDGWTVCDGDCNDYANWIYPGAPEICCNGIDEDCDGESDEGCPACADCYGDGWTICEGDCNDSNPNVHPGAPERCNNQIDDDCDGQINERCPPPPIPHQE